MNVWQTVTNVILTSYKLTPTGSILPANSFARDSCNLNPDARNRTRLFALLLTTFLLAVGVGSVSATSYTWTGTTSTAWATTTNWTPNGNPGSAAGDVVIIPTGSRAPLLTVAPANALASLTFTTTNTLTITGVTLTVTGAVANSTSGGTGTVTGTGTLSAGSVSIGTGAALNFGSVVLNVSGTTTVGGTSGTLTLSNATGAKTFTGLVTVNSGATWTESAAAIPTFQGGITNNGTFTASTGIHTFSTNAQVLTGTLSIPSVTVTGIALTNNGTLTVATALAGATGTLTNSGTLNLGGTCSIGSTSGGLSNSGTVAVTGTGNITTLLAGFTNTGTLNLNGSGTIAGITNNAAGIVNLTNSGTITSFNNATSTSTLNISDLTPPTFTALTVSAAGNTVNYTGAGNQTVVDVAYSNLGTSGSGTKTWTEGAARVMTGNLTVGDGTTLSLAGAYAFTVSGTTTIGTGTSGILSITNATGTKTFTGAVNINAGGAITETAAATLAFGNNVTIGGTLTENGAATVGIAGSLTNNGTYTASTGVHTFSGTAQTMGGTSTNTIPSAAFTGTYTNNGTLTVATALSGTGSLTQAANATLNIGGTSGITTLTATASGNTVSYTGAGQTINSTNYYNLTLSGSGTDVLQTGTTSISGNLTLSGSVSTTPAVGLTIGGNLSIGNGTTFTTGNYALTVTGTTTIGAGTTGNLTISSANGATLFTGLVTVAAGATWNNSGGAAVEFRGGITNSGTFTSGYGIYTFDTNNQALTGTFTIQNVTITGITLTNNNTLTVGTALSGTGGVTQGGTATLNIGGTCGITTLNASAGTNTVIYTNLGGGTAFPTTYYNLTLYGAYTFATAPTVNGVFDLNTNGTITITAGGSVNYGSAATLQYDQTNTPIVSQVEWPTPFTATGGVIFHGASTYQIESACTLGTGVPLTINTGTTLIMYNAGTQLTLGGNFTNNGTFTTSGYPVIITGTAAQNIAGFTTSGSVSVTKTSGTATLTSKLSTGTLSISGGGFLNLGSLTTHTATSLTLGGVGESAGTWGGTSSGATYISPSYFSTATGYVTVSTASCTAGAWTGFTSTDWNTATNWCSGVVPTATTNVIINSGGNQPVIGSAGGTCNSITINSGASLTVSGAYSLTVGSGNWTNNGGTFNPGTGTVTFNAGNSYAINGTATSQTFYNIIVNNTQAWATLSVGGSTTTLMVGGNFTLTNGSFTAPATMIVAGNWTNNGGTFTAGTGTVTMTGTTKTIGGTLSTTFNNLSLTGTAAVTTGIATTVSGNLTVGDGTNFTVPAYAFTVTGTTTIGNGTSGVFTISSATGAKLFTGLVTVNAGANWTNSGNTPVEIRGGIANSGTFTAGSGVYTFDTNNQSLTGTLSIPSMTVTGVTLTNNNSLTVSTALSGSGGLTQAANSTLNIGGTSGITTLTATASGNTVSYTGAGQTINSTNYYNLTLAGSGTDLLQGGTTTINGNFTTSGSETVAAVTGLTIGGNVTLGSGTTFTAGAFTHNVAGNWTNNGTFTNAGSTINLNGSSAQTIGGNTSTTFNNLTINNSTGVTLSAATTVSGILTLTNGTLTTTSTNLLSVTNTATTAITGGSATSFINGPVKWTLPASLASGSTYNYPVGSGTTYLPLSLVNPTSGTGTVTAQVQAFATSANGTYDATLTSLSTTEYWSLTTTGNFTNSSVSLTRQTAISPLNTIGVSTTSSTGTYTYLGGTAGTYGVTGSNTVSGSSYFILAQAAGTSFWYKADVGTSTTTNGAGITLWNDQSGTSNNATVLTTGTGTITYAGNTINFNPSLTFTNVSLQMLTNKTANVQSFIVVTLPGRSAGTNLNADYAGLIGASSDNGIRLDATGYIWSGNAANSGTGIGLNNNDWSYITSTTGISRINGVSGWAFTNWHIVNQTRNAMLNSQYYLGGYYSVSARPYYGSIAEVMAFPGATVPQQNSVETYLGVKYGITLGHNYIAGNGAATVYTISGYANNIAGLGNDNTYGLNQNVSTSINFPSGSTSSQIVMATTNDFTSSNQASSRTSLTNGQYLIWGDNGGTTTSWTTSGSHYIVSRTWQVQNTGSVGAVNFQIDLTSYPISASGSYALLMATNSTFSSGVTMVPLTNTSGNLYTANITFPAGTSYFTITSPVMAAVYVRIGGYGTKDGTSWTNAMATIQKAVETSSAMTTKIPVYVAAGNYYQDPNYITGDYASYTSGNWQGWTNTFVMRDGVNVYGAFPEFGNASNTNASGVSADTTMRGPLNTSTLYLTTLNAGPSPGPNQNYRVLGPPYAKTPLNSGTGLTISTKWDGFQLTGANMTTDASGGDDDCGGGVFTVANSTISNCIIENNIVGGGTTNDGAGAEMYGGTLLSCIVSNNNGTGSNSAGTINIHAGGSNVINSLIYNNITTMAGGAMSIYTTTYNSSTPCYIINNTMVNNTITGTGYACEIHIFGGSGLYFYNNAIWNTPAVSNTVSGVTSGNEEYNAWPNLYSGTLGTGSFVLNSTNTGTTAPYFVSPTNTPYDYRLQSTSSALYNKGGTNTQTGTTLVPTTDIRGVFRNTPPEIGCYELASRLYYVNNAKGTDASGYGGNWSMPYATLHYALDQYSQYDFPQVRVAQGSGAYYATEDSTGVTTSGSTTTFALKKNLSIYGGFSGIRGTEPTSFAGITTTLNARNMKNYPTVLSGNAISTSVVKSSSTYSSVGTTPAILDGFTITGAASGGYAVSTPADTVKIQNCKIINNGGGGLHLNNLNKITNVVVANNSGIGISLAGTANVVNATIANNTSYGITSSSTTATVTNSILWGNNSNGDNVNISGSTPTITYTASGAASAYTNSTNGTIANNSWSANPGNIELYHRSPNFKKAANYELLLISPCLGKGLASANTLPTDANGKARLYSGTIDMGAYQKWDGMTVTSGTPATLTNVRAGYSIPLSSLTLMNDTMEVLVNPGVTFGMGGNTGLQTYWLELKQDTINNNPILSTGKIMADSVLYVRRFSKSLGGLGVWSFFGLPYTSANLGKLDGAIAENSVRIDKYIENTRATNGANKSAWTHMESSSDVKDSLLTGQGYALSFNEKVPQSDIGQTVIFPSPASVTFDNSATTPAGTDVLLETNSITSGDLWYNCGWNLVANPLTQTSTFVNAAGNWPQTSGTYSSYYGTVYLYQSATDSYTVYPLSTFNSSGLSAFGACFLQTDYAGSPAVFNASPSLTSPLRSQSLVAATSANGVPAPTLFHFNVAGSNQKSDAYVMFYDSAHADARPMEDAPIMEGVSGKAALTMNTTATGSNLALAINRLPFVGSEMEIPLQVTVPAAGTYTITMPESDGSTAVYILDTNNGYYDLKNEYSVTAKEAGTLNYMLVFGQINRVQTDSNVGITLIQDQTSVTINTTGSATLQHIYIYSETGQLMNALDNLGNEVQFNLPSATGVYLVKITTSLGSITKKLINR